MSGLERYDVLMKAVCMVSVCVRLIEDCIWASIKHLFDKLNKIVVSGVCMGAVNYYQCV